MPAPTPSQAKNNIARALWELADRSPSQAEIANLWRHFNSECVYCGKHLVKGNRNAHIDHLVANRSARLNHISNRVLACNICNGDEKREGDWQKFLAEKWRGDEAEYVIRSARIREWQQQCGMPSQVDAEIIAEVERAVRECNAKLDEECTRIRQLLRNAGGE